MTSIQGQWNDSYQDLNTSIFSHCSIGDLCRLSRVSKKFHKDSTLEYIWKRRFQRDQPHDLEKPENRLWKEHYIYTLRLPYKINAAWKKGMTEGKALAPTVGDVSGRVVAAPLLTTASLIAAVCYSKFIFSLFKETNSFQDSPFKHYNFQPSPHTNLNITVIYPRLMGSLTGGLATSIITAPFFPPEIAGFATSHGILLGAGSASDLTSTVSMLKGIGLGAAGVGAGAATGAIIGACLGSHRRALTGMVLLATLVNISAPLIIMLPIDPNQANDTFSLNLTAPIAATFCTYIILQSIPFGGVAPAPGSEIGRRIGQTPFIRKISGSLLGSAKVTGELVHYIWNKTVGNCFRKRH